ncbi:MAG TPA: hypothetical protein VNH22_03520 [Blastocatellia bacterium]|jgi:hypothetical protein|nr:hypothetical protein [Blastocatellia bacterium]
MFSHYKSTVILRDGSTMRARPIRPEDDVKLLDLYHRLSSRSLYNRFLAQNRPMMKVLSQPGFGLTPQIEAGVFLVSLSLDALPLP